MTRSQGISDGPSDIPEQSGGEVIYDRFGVVSGMESGHLRAPSTQEEDDAFGLGLEIGPSSRPPSHSLSLLFSILTLHPIRSSSVFDSLSHLILVFPFSCAGHHLDCLDTDFKWRLAQVTRATPDQIFVHYIGWKNKWDEWIPRTGSRKIKP